MYNILFTNAGRRATLLKDFQKSLGKSAKIIATDNWCVAPALFVADKYYLSPKIQDPNYITFLLEICKKEKVNAVTSLIDPEIMLLAENRQTFIENGILPLVPDKETAEICFDKYKMYEYLTQKGIKTVQSYKSMEQFEKALQHGDLHFPVFIKPRTGSGSVGAQKVNDMDTLKTLIAENKFQYIIQEFMGGEDFDADVYIDAISGHVVSAFSKKKIETRIGGASKTISFKDEILFEFIKKICNCFKFCGPIDIDFFYKNGTYYLNEINPRFGGAYLHAYGAGVDFPKMIANNIDHKENISQIGEYDEDVLMIMYDDVIITKKTELRGDYND